MSFNNHECRLTRARRTRTSGFSLIEIMIVLVVIGIMAGAATLAMTHWIDKGRVNRAKSDIGNYVTAINGFYAEKSRYPTNDEGLAVLAPTYVSKIVNDPWGKPYDYHVPGSSGPFEVVSYGADAREGGDGIDADISSESLDEQKKEG